MAGSASIEAEIERVQAGAHELAELRLLNALRTGDVALRAEEQVDAARLLGGDGQDLRARLGVDPSSPDEDVLAAFGDALARWQRRAENPITTGQAAEAARILVRTCEALAASLPRAGDRIG